jgi:site-specific DNA-methyltransferase (adenine-specific)
LFCGRRFLHRATIALEDAGFNVRDVLAWQKPGAHHRAQRLSIVLERRGLNDQAEGWTGWRLGNLAPVFEPVMWFSKPYAYTVVDNVLEYGVGAMNPAAFEAYSGSRTNVITTWFADGEARLHEAQKPQRLLEALISLATRPGQVVLDPFAGACTTALASAHLGRHFICVESDTVYADVGRQRLAQSTAQMKLF